MSRISKAVLTLVGKTRHSYLAFSGHYRSMSTIHRCPEFNTVAESLPRPHCWRKTEHGANSVTTASSCKRLPVGSSLTGCSMPCFFWGIVRFFANTLYSNRYLVLPGQLATHPPFADHRVWYRWILSKKNMYSDSFGRYIVWKEFIQCCKGEWINQKLWIKTTINRVAFFKQ